MKVMIELLTGVTEEAEWHPLAEVMDKHPLWTQFKATFRRAASTDIEVGPKMAALVEKLVEAGFSTEGIRSMAKAVESITEWRKTCRGKSQATVAVEGALQTAIDRVAYNIVRVSANRVDIELANKLMETMAA